MRPLLGLFLALLCPWLGGCAMPAEFAVASYAADGGLLLATDKTSNDHLLSMAAGRDCALWRIVRGRAICKNFRPGEENPYDVDYDAPYREVGEGGMVWVYTASRQGGELLTGEAAVKVLRAQTSGVTLPPGDVAPVPSGDQNPQIAGGRTVELADVLPASDTVVPAAAPATKPPPSRAAARIGGKARTKSAAGPGLATRPAPASRTTASRTAASKPDAGLPAAAPREGRPTRSRVEAPVEATR